MKNNKYCVIMAGGVGSRFWPKSRQSMPKQFLDILGSGKSFIRHTFERFLPMVPVENFLVVTNAAYRELVLDHIPELSADQVLCEPVGRNTAPCICYAAYLLRKINPQAEMIVTPADHYIHQEDEFRCAVGECVEFSIKHNALITLGIKPTRPETGYGYIQISDSSPITKVKCFTEKPTLEIAQTFIQHKEFFWNSGIFVWKVSDIVSAIELHLPDYHTLFSAIEPQLRTPQEGEAIAQLFAQCKPISIDYGVMERADNVYVRCGDFGWSDVGTWGSVYQHSNKDNFDNATSEDAFMFNTHNSIVSLPKGKIAVVSGLEDYIVVDTDDVLMICPRSEEQNIKKFIDEVKYNKGNKFL
ncbi:MAG: mannose-1-phosphate guanylyltransferase [Rikenellaceae bacterium]